MGKYTIFYLFENPRRGMEARNFTTNVLKILDLKSSSEQIFFPKIACRWVPLMAAPAANEVQPQGPQVPRVPQANVVQPFLAERPPQKPILDTNGLEVMCLSFFHTSLALLPLFMCTCRQVLICPFPAFTCVVFVLHSI